MNTPQRRWTDLSDLSGIAPNSGPLPFAARDMIVARVKASAWHQRDADPFGDLFYALDELADVDTIEWFTQAMEALWDLADRAGVWIIRK